MKQLAIFLTLPFVLAVPPVLGWFLGSKIDELCGTAPIFMYLLIVLGMIAGFRELYRLISRYGRGI
jgi:ATP synthase protein I